jgi:transcriptional regulator with XRE-family HTH domain
MGEVNAVQVGHRLAQLREAAGLKQVDLSRQVTIGASTLSRIESGDRAAAPEELEAILAGIGTAEATRFAELLTRDWKVLDRPALDHPDNDLLWAAEKVALQLRDLAGRQDTRQAFSNRLNEYAHEIERQAGLVDDRSHRIAFIGSIGVGKSTAICKATGLEVRADTGASPVLEAGAGGITLCEVRLRPGPAGAFGIVIEPRTDLELRDDVADFADQQLRLARGDAGGDLEASASVSRELDRAIRNMSGLVKKKSGRLPSGQRSPVIDPARDLAAKYPAPREYIAEVLALMQLHRRDRRDIWWDPSIGDSELEWLRKTFRQINNGRHPEFGLPARIDIIVPQVLQGSGIDLSIIDTRGIDQPAGRADLESHLGDPHTLSVLCSSFNAAPEMSVKTLLTRAIETGNDVVRSNATVLVLPKNAEALAVKHDDGYEVESVEEGYDLKEDQVRANLSPLGLNDLPVRFFDAHADDAAIFRSALIDQVEATRVVFRRDLDEVIERAIQLLERAEEEEVLAEQREVGAALRNWLDDHRTVPPVRGHVHDMLINDIKAVHAASVHASVRREGEWHSLSYSHQLGFGSRRMAFSALHRTVEQFKGLCSYEAERHSHAAELTTQASMLLAQSFEEMLRKLEIVGSTIFKDQLQFAQTLWMEASALWGQGSGYRDGVAAQLQEWFAEDDRHAVEEELLAVMAREWAAVCDRVSDILDVD